MGVQVDPISVLSEPLHSPLAGLGRWCHSVSLHIRCCQLAHLTRHGLRQHQECANWMALIMNHAAHVQADWVAPLTQACKRWPTVTAGMRRSGSLNPPVSHPGRQHCSLVLGLLQHLLLISQVRESRISLGQLAQLQVSLAMWPTWPPSGPSSQHTLPLSTSG